MSKFKVGDSVRTLFASHFGNFEIGEVGRVVHIDVENNVEFTHSTQVWFPIPNKTIWFMQKDLEASEESV